MNEDLDLSIEIKSLIIFSLLVVNKPLYLLDADLSLMAAYNCIVIILSLVIVGKIKLSNKSLLGGKYYILALILNLSMAFILVWSK
jgi:hypothetical protein